MVYVDSQPDWLKRKTVTAAAANADYSDSAMIAVYPDAASLDKLHLEGGEDREQLHCTLIFLGKVASLDTDAVASTVKDVSSRFGSFTAHVGGYAIFQTDDGRVLVALVDSPDLEQLQQELHDELKSVADYPDNHGFTAHVSLKYLADDEEVDPAWFARPTFDLEVNGVCAKLGTERDEYALTASMELGDYEGHPFRGNQWTGGRGEDEKAAERAAIKARVDAAFKAGLTTEDLYDKDKFGAPGLWSPEREAQHQEIVDSIFARNTDVPHDAEAIIMGGLMGAGKSTIIADERSGIDASQYLTINPDDIKDELIARDLLPPVDTLKPMEMAGLIHEESSKIAWDISQRAQADGTNILWDISMSSPGSVVKRLQELTDDLGPKYNTKMVFVDVPISLSQERALARYEGGGRFMDPALLDSFADDEWGSKNRAAFEAVKDQADTWQVWDNSGDFDPKLIAEKK